MSACIKTDMQETLIVDKIPNCVFDYIMIIMITCAYFWCGIASPHQGLVGHCLPVPTQFLYLYTSILYASIREMRSILLSPKDDLYYNSCEVQITEYMLSTAQNWGESGYTISPLN